MGYKDLQRIIKRSIVIIIIITVTLYIYIGFFYDDPYGYARFGMKYSLIIWGIRIFFPIAVALVAIKIRKIMRKELSIANAGLFVVSTILVMALIYPVGNLVFEKFKSNKKVKKYYHPYLQLSPNLYSEDIKNSYQQVEISCLGGSTTEFKGKDKKGWPKRVEEITNGNFRKNIVKIHNFGRQWYTTLHSLINYEANIRHKHSDIIIVMHGINDLLHNADFSYFSHSAFREDYGHFYGPVERLIAGRSFWGEIRERMNFWYHKPRELISTTYFPGLLSFERNLNTLIDLAEKDGIKIVLMTQPFLFKKKMTKKEIKSLHMLNVEAVGKDKRWALDTVLNGMEAYNEKTRKIAKNRNIYLIDLEKVVPKNLEYFWDDVHYTEKAFDIIAKFVYEELQRQKILKNIKKMG